MVFLYHKIAICFLHDCYPSLSLGCSSHYQRTCLMLFLFLNGATSSCQLSSSTTFHNYCSHQLLQPGIRLLSFQGLSPPALLLLPELRHHQPSTCLLSLLLL